MAKVKTEAVEGVITAVEPVPVAVASSMATEFIQGSSPVAIPPPNPPYVSPKPSLGRIVIFGLSEQNAAEINRRRTSPYSIGERIKINSNSNTIWPLGAQAHIGNEVSAGESFPAMVVSCGLEDSSVNLQVFLDGNDTYWAQAVEEGDGEGQWQWPVRV